MANLFENKDRRVVPNWRSFQKTVALGELNVYRNQLPNKQKLILSIDSYIKDWTFYRSSIYAGELLSAAKVNGFETDPNVIEAAEFLIKNPKNVSKSQQLLAKTFIEPQKSKHTQYQLDSIRFDQFQQHVKPEFIWDKIRLYKRYTKVYPYNAIFWVELSRYYSILGLKNKALNAMKVAIHLAPENRFILRSASRLFAHYDDIEYAHDLLRKSKLVRYDPWFTSAEIALATIRNRTSRFIKRGMEMINSKSFSPFSITELSSSIGTVELLNGSIKKSRYFFNKSLIEPNDNSLAQIEWASEKDHQLDIDQSSYEVINSFEAQALANYHDEKYNEALDNTYQWFMDMPFSKRPVMFGSYIASIFKDDHLSSRNFLKAGLYSHPYDPQILNNLAYSLALENKLDDAYSYLNKIRSHHVMNDTTKICLTATKGLLYYRKGYVDFGRTFYLDAIKQTKSIRNKYLNNLAILNFAREEILRKSKYAEKLMNSVYKIPDDLIDRDINKLKKEVINLYDKNKNNLK